MGCYRYLREMDWLGHSYYTPEVVLSMKAADGTDFNMVTEVDSGASISLMPREIADVIGLDWESGEPIGLQGVGGASFIAYVHEVPCTVAGANFTIPIAFPQDIGEDYQFPPLLGRLGLYDQASVFMDNVNHGSCVGAVNSLLPAPSACEECARESGEPSCPGEYPTCPSQAPIGEFLPAPSGFLFGEGFDWTTVLIIAAIAFGGIMLVGRK